MELDNERSIVGAFHDLATARMTADELKMAGFDDDEVRIVEEESRCLVIVTSLDELREAEQILRHNGADIEVQGTVRRPQSSGRAPEPGVRP